MLLLQQCKRKAAAGELQRGMLLLLQFAAHPAAAAAWRGGRAVFAG